MNSLLKKFLVSFNLLLIISLGIVVYLILTNTTINFRDLLSFFSTPTPSSAGTNINSISLTEFKRIYETFTTNKTSEIMIFDLREPEEYKKGHLSGAYNLPFSIIQKGNFALPKENIKIIFYSDDKTINPQQLQAGLSLKQVPEVEVVNSNYPEWQQEFEQETGSPRSERP